MNNIQAYKRCDVDGKGIIMTPKGDIPLHLENISASGALISVPQTLPVNKTYPLQLSFYINIVLIAFQAEARIVKFEGTVDNQYIYDIKFYNMKDSDRIRIDEMINHSFETVW